MIEPYNLFFKVLEFDQSDEDLNLANLHNELTKQLVFKCEQKNFVLTIQIWPQGLEQQVKKLAEHNELIIFTILPQQAIRAIIENLVPQLKDCFSIILSNENLAEEETSNHYFKDIGLLAGNRMENMDPPGDLFVIDTLDYFNHVDQDLIQYV